VRNSAEGAVRFLRRRTKNIAPSAMRPSTATAPMMPPAMAPALEWAGVLLLLALAAAAVGGDTYAEADGIVFTELEASNDKIDEAPEGDIGEVNELDGGGLVVDERGALDEGGAVVTGEEAIVEVADGEETVRADDEGGSPELEVEPLFPPPLVASPSGSPPPLLVPPESLLPCLPFPPLAGGRPAAAPAGVPAGVPAPLFPPGAADGVPSLFAGAGAACVGAGWAAAGAAVSPGAKRSAALG